MTPTELKQNNTIDSLFNIFSSSTYYKDYKKNNAHDSLYIQDLINSLSFIFADHDTLEKFENDFFLSFINSLKGHEHHIVYPVLAYYVKESHFTTDELVGFFLIIAKNDYFTASFVKDMLDQTDLFFFTKPLTAFSNTPIDSLFDSKAISTTQKNHDLYITVLSYCILKNESSDIFHLFRQYHLLHSLNSKDITALVTSIFSNPDKNKTDSYCFLDTLYTLYPEDTLNSIVYQKVFCSQPIITPLNEKVMDYLLASPSSLIDNYLNSVKNWLDFTLPTSQFNSIQYRKIKEQGDEFLSTLKNIHLHKQLQYDLNNDSFNSQHALEKSHKPKI